MMAAITGKKVFPSAAAACHDIEDGSKLLVGGFGLCGVPENLLRAIKDKGAAGLTVVSSNVGTDERGLGLLFQSKQVRKMVGSYVGENKIFEQQYLNGEVVVELVPMGTLAERMRAAGAGIPAFFTRTGAGTLVQHGSMPTRYADDGSRTVAASSAPRRSEHFRHPLARDDCSQTCEYILEHALSGDFALVKAWKGDTEGNLVYRKTVCAQRLRLRGRVRVRGTGRGRVHARLPANAASHSRSLLLISPQARNHNPAIATAGRVTIAEVEELVPAGELDPDAVHTPGIYVQRVVQGDRMGLIERLTLADAPSESFSPETNPNDAMRERIVRRAALELSDGDYVNLGASLPPLAVPAPCHRRA